MKKNSYKFRKFGVAALVTVLSSFVQLRVVANPQGPTVVHGAAATTTTGPQLTVKTSDRAFIEWKSFNIGAGESTRFLQPSASSITWNKINDANPSQIFGNLSANGIVVLQNQSGFYIGPYATINAQGVLMTTSHAVPTDFLGTGPWQLGGPPPSASIINYGQINAGPGGSAFLIAKRVENHGTITAPEGNIGLYAGKDVLISERPDGRGLSARVHLPEGSVDNTGKLIADAGTIALHADVVNQGGLIQANSIRERNGVIELVAGEAVNLAAGSSIQAKGDDHNVSPGGQILIKSDGAFADNSASTISVAGGSKGGNGGQVEISAIQMNSINSKVEGGAAAGWLGGTVVIDPVNITLQSGTGSSATSGTINKDDPGYASDLTLDVKSLASFSQILLQASQNISLSTAWVLGDSTDVNGSLLTLQAGNDIRFNTQGSLILGKDWSVRLIAGADFVDPTKPNSVIVGKGGIYLDGDSSLQTANGSIEFHAGKEVVVVRGRVATLGGGNIDVTAVSGQVNTGIGSAGYSFSAVGLGYNVSPSLGGISTAAGGNVNISAGGNVTSFLPTLTANLNDAGTGAFGPTPGNVTITAGGSVTGHYVVANGAGVINAGINAGNANKLLALSLINGSWMVNAPNGAINLQEVRNPNGIFNTVGGGSAPTTHRFDYAPDSSVTLNGNSVSLAGGALPRAATAANAVPIIYPPTLTIDAGPGGITLGNSVKLYPSPTGNLTIDSVGSMQASIFGANFQLTMSDSGVNRWSLAHDFGAADHRAYDPDHPLAALIHYDDLYSAKIHIGGDLKDLFISIPKKTELTVGGDMDRTGFYAQNLHPGDTTSITVGGRLWNRNDYTFYPDQGGGTPLTSPPDFDLLKYAVHPDGTLVFPSFPPFVYNPTLDRLGFKGKMDATLEQLLQQAWQVLKISPITLLPEQNQDGTYVVDTSVPARRFAEPAVIADLFTRSQDVPGQSAAGYQISGPGTFKVTAGSLDLGVTQGLNSVGPEANYALARVTDRAATIDLRVNGNIDMFSSAISSIYKGGDIKIDVGGSINVGSQELLGGATFARGIYTSGQANIDITAKGDIDVAGSRIAAYSGGDIHIVSTEGNVNAGNGGVGSVIVRGLEIDPVTYEVTPFHNTIAGSGIMATTLPNAPFSSTVGDILIETPRGSIYASAGGIVQVALNGNTSPNATLKLTAGSRDADYDPQNPTPEHPKEFYDGDIIVTQSGVIGGNVSLDATRNISGLVVARQNTDIKAAQNFSGTVLAAGNANVSAGGSITGTIIGGGGVNASATSVDAALLSQNVTASGASVTTQGGLAASAAPSATSQNAASATANEATATTEKKMEKFDEDDSSKKKRPMVAKATGRVTVILPK